MNTVAEQHIEKTKIIYLGFALPVVWFLLPVATIPLLCIYAAINKTSRIPVYVLLSISFGLIAYTVKCTSVAQTDSMRYFQAHVKLSNINTLQELLVSQVLIAGEINALYIAMSFALAKIFPETPQVVLLFWVTIAYLFMFLTYHEFQKIKPLTPDSYLLYLILVVLLGIPFYQTTETMKQCVSVSLFAYAVLLRMNDKKSSWFWIVCSILIHMSSLMLLPVFLLMRKRWVLKYALPITLVIFVFSFINVVELFNDYLSSFLGAAVAERSLMYSDYDWDLSRRFYVILGFYFVVVSILLLGIYRNNENKKTENFVTIQVLAFIILLLNRNNTHNFIRYTLCYYPFFILAILSFDLLKINKKEKIVLWFFCLAFFGYMNISLLNTHTDLSSGYANMYFNGSYIEMLTSNIYTIISSYKDNSNL